MKKMNYLLLCASLILFTQTNSTFITVLEQKLNNAKASIANSVLEIDLSCHYPKGAPLGTVNFDIHLLKSISSTDKSLINGASEILAHLFAVKLPNGYATDGSKITNLQSTPITNYPTTGATQYCILHFSFNLNKRGIYNVMLQSGMTEQMAANITGQKFTGLPKPFPSIITFMDMHNFVFDLNINYKKAAQTAEVGQFVMTAATAPYPGLAADVANIISNTLSLMPVPKNAGPAKLGTIKTNSTPATTANPGGLFVLTVPFTYPKWIVLNAFKSAGLPTFIIDVL